MIPHDEKTPSEPRWTLFRDMGVMQVKLLVDGLRDLVLVPASLIAGIVSLATARDGKPGPQFYNLLELGKQSEAWINLFGAIKNSPERPEQPLPFGDTDIDDLVGKIESFVVDEYKRGGVTAQAKERMDKVLGAVRRKKAGPDRAP